MDDSIQKIIKTLNNNICIYDETFTSIGLKVKHCNYKLSENDEELSIYLDIALSENTKFCSDGEIKVVCYDAEENIIFDDTEFITYSSLINTKVFKFSIDNKSMWRMIAKTTLSVDVDEENYVTKNGIIAFLKKNTEVLDETFQINNLKIINYGYLYQNGFALYLEIGSSNGERMNKNASIKLNVYGKQGEIIKVFSKSIYKDYFMRYDTIIIPIYGERTIENVNHCLLFLN